MGATWEPLVEVLRAQPERTAVLLDFDGTLAAIVDDPAAAVPMVGVRAALTAVHERFGKVAVISGRPVAYLQAHLPAAVGLVGLYGLEEVRDGEIDRHPEALRWERVVDEVAADARQQLPDVVGVEHKGLSLTLHVRRDPAQVATVQDWASAAAARSGLLVRAARMSAELHPPVDTDKGTVVRSLLNEADVEVACFIGDDVGDLPAYDALDSFAAEGGISVRFVVASVELDPTLRARADALLDGPAEVLEVLRALVG